MKVNVVTLMRDYDIDAVVIGVDPDGTFVYEVRVPVAIEDVRKINIDVMPSLSRLVIQGLEETS